MEEGTLSSLGANEAVVPESALKEAEARICELELLPGQEDARGRDPQGGGRDRARKKMDLAVAVARQEVAGLGVARSQFIERLRRGVQERGPWPTLESDAELVAEVRAVVDACGSYDYRRVTAVMNRGRRKKGRPPVNHKRTYRVMRAAVLLLARHTGKPTCTHDGKVMTLKSDVRWCSDAFKIRC